MEFNGQIARQDDEPIPTVTIRLLPPLLVGGQNQLEVKPENCPWPMAMQLLAKALDASMPKAYEQIQAIAQQQAQGIVPMGIMGIQRPGRN